MRFVVARRVVVGAIGRAPTRVSSAATFTRPDSVVSVSSSSADVELLDPPAATRRRPAGPRTVAPISRSCSAPAAASAIVIGSVRHRVASNAFIRSAGPSTSEIRTP